MVSISACVRVNVTTEEKPQKFDNPEQEPQVSESEYQNEVNDMLTRTDVETLRAELNITEDYRQSFVHGEKPANCQKYIMLHDTEGNNDEGSVVTGWDNNGNLVAAHFVVNKDGSIWQCVPLDKIAHHEGYGDTGHNVRFGVEDESHDDKRGRSLLVHWLPTTA